jgi:serine/threonine-protein kinase HipA
VRDRDGALAIAKFPKKEEDDYSVEVWEEVALRLADKAKIRTAPHRLERPLGKPVLLSRRFDRDGEVRVPFLSALAMLDFADGQRGSYPEVVDALRRTGSKAESDVPELYRRMVFNVLISNVDDHLRNHGFIWKGEHGWRLSPAYDINPIPADLKERILCTNITLDDGTCDLELLRETSEFFDLDVAQADAIISEVAVAVTSWREVAAGYGVRPSEIDRMASAFEHDDLKQALVNKTSSPPPQAARP